jgi:hypothetical protein
MMFCVNGFKKDENGCEYCACNEKPVQNKCNEVLCEMFCEYGFKKDKNGCEYCECQEPTPGIDIGKRNICSDVMCMMFCENGFKKDASIVPCKICRASIVLEKICELSKK